MSHHDFFDQQQGRFIYFEGTYTTSFSSTRLKTPLYDYNQILYRLDLDDARLNLPVPVRVSRRDGSPDILHTGSGTAGSNGPIVFWALERPGEGTVDLGQGNLLADHTLDPVSIR